MVAQAEPPKVNLLVDIQAKLQTGKGAGYARWAKVFNLKQMAQTLSLIHISKCMICGAPIWAAGSAITGSNLCFTCTTGEANDSDDYEIE